MPVVIPLLVPLLAFLAAITALALARTENLWLRPLVEWLAEPRGNFIKKTALRATGFVAKAILSAERHVRSALSHSAAASLHLLTRFFNGLATLAHHTFAEIEHLADDVADAFSVLVHHKIPAIVHAIAHPIDVRARAALGLAHRSISLIRELDRRLSHGIDRLRHLVEGVILARLHGIDRLIRGEVLPGIRRAERAIGGVITRDLPALWRRERALERDLVEQGARLKRIEKALGLGIFAALIYRTLARVAPWLFCRNVKKVGNALCSMNQNRLNDLLGLMLGAFVLSDLRQLFRFAESVTEEVARGVGEVVTLGDLPRGRFTVD